MMRETELSSASPAFKQIEELMRLYRPAEVVERIFMMGDSSWEIELSNGEWAKLNRVPEKN